MKKICVILIFVVWCVGAMEGGTDVSAFHDDPDEIASPVIEKSSDPKQAFAMLRGKKSDNVLSLQGMGKNVGQEDKTEALLKGKKQGKDMDAEKAKALFEGGGDLTKSEESTECLNPRSSVVALVRSRFESDIHRVGYSLSFTKFKNTNTGSGNLHDTDSRTILFRI